MTHKARLSRVLPGAALLLGLWLLLSPGILGYHSFDATAQQVIIGLIVTLVAGVRIALPEVHWPSWISVVLGVELIFIPLNIGIVSNQIHWNTTVVGLLVLALALPSVSRYLALRSQTQRPSVQ